MESRPDYPEPVHRIREMKREAEINPTILSNLQVRQRPGQQFQQTRKPAAWTVDPKLFGYVGHLLNRLLQQLGGHQPSGRSIEHIFSRNSLTGNSDSLVNHGRCKHTQTLSRVWLKEVNQLQHALFSVSP